MTHLERTEARIIAILQPSATECVPPVEAVAQLSDLARDLARQLDSDFTRVCDCGDTFQIRQCWICESIEGRE